MADNTGTVEREEAEVLIDDAVQAGLEVAKRRLRVRPGQLAAQGLERKIHKHSHLVVVHHEVADLRK